MEFKGTKGKWKIYCECGNENITIETVNEDICEVLFDNGSEEETRANALLISKAPELLEALNWALIELSNLNSNYEQLSSISEQIECCRELIKKATEL